MRQVVHQQTDVLEIVEAAYREHLEVAPARASISFLGVEQLEILRFADVATSADHYCSLGMSRHAMVDPTANVVDEVNAPRAELMMTVLAKPDGLWRQLAVLAAAPAVEGSVYSVGNRVDLGAALCAGSRCTGVVLQQSGLRPIKVTGMAEVEVLQAVPATANELAWARVHGTPALVQRWNEQQIDLHDLMRQGAVLT
ncbi:suppressor of fused domain protein [soil metagenome]